MIVRCQNCQTEFGFDARQLGNEAISVRCSVCAHVFMVESPTAAPRPWKIRTTDGDSFTAPDVATLREWIDEGRMHPDDQVSRTGRSWVRLGDMPEFAAAFEGFADVAAAVKPHAVSPADPARVRSAPTEIGPPPSFTWAGAQSAPVPPPPEFGQPEPKPSGSPLARAGQSLTGSVKPIPAATLPPSTPPPEPAPKPVAPKPIRTLEPEPPRPSSSRLDELADVEDEFDVRPEPKRRPRREPSETDDLDAFEAAPQRRGIGPGLIAFLGVIAAVGVMFGVPSIRERLLNLGLDDDEQADAGANANADHPDIQAANVATRGLGVGQLASAEASLQRAIDTGGGDEATTAAMKVALAKLLATRALAYELAAALDGEQREELLGRAEEDQEDAERLIDSVANAPDGDELARVRALSRLAAGREAAEVLPLVPDGEAETKLLVRGASLWRDPEAPVPEGLSAGLQGLAQRSGLGDSVLALALLRAGDIDAAQSITERMLVGAQDHIVGRALRTAIGDDGSGGETGGEGAEGEADDASSGSAEPGADAGDEGDDAGVAKAPPVPGGGGGGGGGGGSRFDRLLDKGCEQVASGNAGEGVKTLLKAFDQKPKDVDVLVCLAQGYAAQGSNARATQFFDRALAQSPKNKAALAGAAKAAAKTGAKKRALDLYERLLAVDPNHAAAKAYVAKHKAGPTPEPKPDPTPSPQPEPPPADGG